MYTKDLAAWSGVAATNISANKFAEAKNFRACLIFDGSCLDFIRGVLDNDHSRRTGREVGGILS